MSKPTLSVLVPNYNHGRYISDNLDGILGQSWPPDEVIVVDDGSTDDSMAVINRYARHDSRVRVYRNERNRGVVYTLNRALELSKGDYVYGGAADDRVRPGFFEKAMTMLSKHPQAGLCYGWGSEFRSDCDQVREYPIRLADRPCYLSPDETAEALRRISLPGHSCTVPGNSALWRRTEFLRAGAYREDLRWHSDWFALQVVALRNGVCFIPESFVFTRMDHTSYSQAGQRLWDQQSKVLDRLLQLVKSEEFSDVLPRFQRGHLFSQFAPWIIRVIVSRPEHWSRDSALLVENSLLEMWKEFLTHANPVVRQGTAFCLGEMGPAADAATTTLCRLMAEEHEVGREARHALKKIHGGLPGNMRILQARLGLKLSAASRRIKAPIRSFAARVYRRANYKLYGRIERLEACLAQLLMENRDQQRQFFEELHAMEELVQKLQLERAELLNSAPDEADCARAA